MEHRRARPGPSWLDEDCPDWCTRVHEEHDHPEDRLHQDDGVLLPAAYRDRDVDEGSALLVRLTRPLHEPTTWVVIGDPLDTRRQIIVSLESAARLAAVLAENTGPI